MPDPPDQLETLQNLHEQLKGLFGQDMDPKGKVIFIRIPQDELSEPIASEHLALSKTMALLRSYLDGEREAAAGIRRARRFHRHAVKPMRTVTDYLHSDSAGDTTPPDGAGL